MPWLRPTDYYAEMIKSDEHMGKVGSALLFCCCRPNSGRLCISANTCSCMRLHQPLVCGLIGVGGMHADRVNVAVAVREALQCRNTSDSCMLNWSTGER